MDKKEILLTSVLSVLAAGAIMALVSCDASKKHAPSETTETVITETTTSETSTDTATSEKVKKSVTITYNFMTDTMENQTVTGYVNDDLELLTPEREGYEFLGWYTSTSYTKSYVDTVFPTTDKTLYAKWGAKTYTITFDPFGNGLKTESLVKYGDVIVYPTYARDGYTFDGWREGENAYSEITMPARDVSLTASWTLNTYHYSYELNGGTNDENNKTTYTVEMEGKSLFSPTKEGYSFAGWYKNEDFSGNRVYDYPTEDCTFYAKWSVNAYALTLTSAHGMDVPTSANNYEYGETVELPTLSATGYTFLGWYNGDTKVEGTSLCMPSSNLTLTAKWELVTYNITYELDGGTIPENAPTSYTVENMDAPKDAILAMTATKTGYTFEDWYINADSTRKFTALPGGDIVLYAEYSINSYTIHYDVNGGDALENADVSVVYNVVPAAVTPTRANYTFEGWTWNDEKIDPATFTMPAENITLKATWSPVPFTVTYDYDYDDLKETATWGYETSVTLIQPTRTGYTFAGWYDEDGNKKEDNFSMVAENITLTAHWTINSYTFTLDYGQEGKDDDVEKLDYQTKITLTAPTRDRYYFAGWYNGETKVEETTLSMPAEDLTLTAHWTAIKYANLTLDYGYDTDKKVTEYAEGTTVTLEKPTRSGYTFDGWYDGETEITGEEITTTTENLTLTAHWKIITYTITYHNYTGTLTSATVDTYNVENTIALTSFPETTREYCDFGGWYTDSDYSSKFEGITKGMTGNIDLYAQENDYFTWSGDEITSITSYAQKNVVGNQSFTIPSSIDGHAITKVKNSTALYVSSLTLAEGITTIEDSGFYSWTMFNTINLPSTLTTIGAHAFYNNASLKNVNFASSSEALQIGELAFEGCSALSALDFTKRTGTITLSEKALHGISGLTTFTVDKNFKSFSKTLFDGDVSKLAVINFKGTKQEFESVTSTLSEYYFGTYSNDSIDGFKIYTSDGCTLYMDKSAKVPVTFYKNGKLNETISLNFEPNSNLSYACYVGDDLDHYYETTLITYNTYLLVDGDPYIDVTTYTKSMTIKPYPCKVYEKSVAGYLTYTVTFKDVDNTNVAYLANETWEVDNTWETRTLPTPEEDGRYIDGWYYKDQYGIHVKITEITKDLRQDLELYLSGDERIYDCDGTYLTNINSYYTKKYGTDATELKLYKVDQYCDLTNFWDGNGTLYENFTSVIVEEGIVRINPNDTGLFYGYGIQKQWNSVEIASSVTYIGKNSFAIASGGTITYKGTTAEWDELAANSNSQMFGSGEHTVTCSDGTRTVTGS